MTLNLDILRMAQSMAAHAAGRQTVVSTNIANSDTPGYKAQEMPSFAASYGRVHDGFQPTATRPNHMLTAEQTTGVGRAHAAVGDRVSLSPNGNNVSIEREMAVAADVQYQHDLALGIYRKSVDILRLGLGRGR